MLLSAALLLPALLAVAPAPGAAASESPRADPCDRIAALADDAACGDQPLCSRRQRVHLACEVKDAIEKRYVFFPVKGRMLPATGGERFDSRRHLDACVEEERALSREDDPLRFYDRMRRCTAAFADGHLILGAPARLPQVALGIGLRLVGGRVHIANREKKLVSYLKTVSGVPDLEEILAVGNEVVEIDGRAAEDRLRELAQYVPGSSEAARLERAVDALTRRDFAFPSRRAASLTVSVNGARRAVELPWWISPDAEGHVMTQAYVRRTGLATTDLLTWRYDQGKDTWDRDAGSAQGSLRTETILPPRDAAGLREYLDDQDRPAVRLGEVVRRRDRAFCYLQILTFHTESLATRDGRQPFAAAVEGFVKECKEKELDLVLDLRQNEGGYIGHSSALLALLGERQKSYPGGALLLRANTLNQLIYQQRAPMVGGVPARSGDDAFEPRHIADAIGAARKAQQEFTPAFLEQPLRASEAVGGYEGRVIALVAPTCMSACDRLAGLLRSSRRALLVGSPTEGAGGSQQEARNLAVRWSDPEGILSLSIPNAAMGVQRVLPVAGEHRPDPSSDEFFNGLTFENRPVLPDVAYATRLDDITGHNRGWMEQVDAALFGREAGGGGARSAASATARP
ncbi:MAG TPA: S41 family peptidase [Anaeromyxobacteraceae bacterium]